MKFKVYLTSRRFGREPEHIEFSSLEELKEFAQKRDCNLILKFNNDYEFKKDGEYEIEIYDQLRENVTFSDKSYIL